jgi:hypothetical protein
MQLLLGKTLDGKSKANILGKVILFMPSIFILLLTEKCKLIYEDDSLKVPERLPIINKMVDSFRFTENKK